MRKILSLSIFCIVTTMAYTQAQITVLDTGSISRERWRDSVFRIDKTQVPTGYLLEYSMFGFEAEKYDGVSVDDTIKNNGRIFELHNILWHSKVNDNASISETDSLFRKAFFDHLNGNVIPLTFIY